MAVAEKNLTETTPQNAVTRLAMTSILGTVYLYAAILVVFHGLPWLWDTVVAGPLGMKLIISDILKFFLERYAGAYRDELAAFVAAVSSGKAPAPSGEDGLRAQLLADAADQSRRTGQVVRL